MGGANHPMEVNGCPPSGFPTYQLLLELSGKFLPGKWEIFDFFFLHNGFGFVEVSRVRLGPLDGESCCCSGDLPAKLELSTLPSRFPWLVQGLLLPRRV